jgi:hypothetical protein
LLNHGQVGLVAISCVVNKRELIWITAQSSRS